MSDNAAAETSTTDAPHHAAPVVDAHTNEAVSDRAPATVETHELIEEAPGFESESTDVSEHEPEEHAAPESDETETKRSGKKSKARGAKAAAVDSVEDTDAGTPADENEVPNEAPTEAVAPVEEPAEPAPPENKKKWYAIKVQSGREDTIKAAILRKVGIEGLEETFSQIMIPFEEVIEKKAVRVKDKKTGEYTTQEKKVTRKRKKFQGYIFAEMEFNDRMLYLIRETSGVGDFLKLRNKKDELPVPEPMSDAEVKQMLGEKVGPDSGAAKKIKIEFEKGDRVRIREGSFKDSEGEVKEITLPKDPTDAPKITVIVTFWGRPLDVELEYWQVAKV